MNEVEQTEVTQPAQEVVESPKAETPPWETAEPSAPQPVATEQEEQRKVKGGFQRRIDELVREREYERAEKQRLHDLLARQTQPQPVQESKSEEKAPTLEQYDSYEKYLAAHARWEAKQTYIEQRKLEQEAATKAENEFKHRQAVEQQQRAMVEQQAALSKLTEEAERKYPDFSEKVFDTSGNVPISPIVAQAILEAGSIGADVAYYLGSNPAEAQRIAKLSPTSQLREFGKLEMSLTKQQSAAPAPINPVTGRKSGNDYPASGDDMKTWIAKRNKQLGR